VQKLWSLLFLPVPIFCVVLFVMAPSYGWWLPENASTFGADVDHLFNVILWIVTIAFVITELVLVYCLFRYTGHGNRATFIHTNHTIEFWWTLIPAGILIFIAVYQFRTWADIKVAANFPNADVEMEVLAGQFEWRIRYPGPDGKLATLDDIVSTNDMHVPVNKNVKIILRSRDVLHSLFLLNMRVKQDAVPGMAIPVWFNATKEGTYDITCAELCGWGHYKMRGRLLVQSQADFTTWLAEKAEEQEADTETAAVVPR